VKAKLILGLKVLILTLVLVVCKLHLWLDCWMVVQSTPFFTEWCSYAEHVRVRSLPPAGRSALGS